MKFIEYLRLHRMVTGVSPKRIWEVLATEQSTELKEYLSQSTPWFSDFVQKWMRALTAEYERIYKSANLVYALGLDAAGDWGDHGNLGQIRKAFAEVVTRPENREFSAVAFAMLNGKDCRPVIWKQVRHMVHGHSPMVDAHT
jgi:RNA ligase